MGKLPFKGENAVEIAIKQMKEKIPSIVSQNNQIPQSIENIVLRACAKNPKNRYDSVTQMHEDLRTALHVDKEEERLVYKYPENDLDETKALPNLSKLAESEEKRETREERNERNERDEEWDEEVKSGNKKGSKLKTAVIAAIILCIVVLLAGVILVMSILKNNEKESVELPSIEGKMQETIVAELKDRGLKVEVEEEPSDDYDVGYVIDYKEKKNGDKVKKGATVTIIVSSGLSGIKIEDYYGKNVQVVQLELESAGLKVVTTLKKVSIKQDDYKEAFEGMILTQSKDPGTRLKEGGVIELVYATLITIYPDFTSNTNDGKAWTQTSIQAFCDDNGIQCTFVKKESAEKAGTILTQSREVGLEVKAGVSMTIEVADPIQVVVPEPDPNVTP
jgi:serine/threonine-protein kinase